jgi:uncharacterized membrane protein YdfJ with MMPL/SSD domain
MTTTIEPRSAARRTGGVPDNDGGLFARLGQTVTAHPVKVAFGWLLVVVALIGISAALGQPTPSQSAASELPAGYESARAQAVIDKAFGAPSSNATAFLVISRTDGQPLSASNRALAGHVADGLTRLEASHPGAAGQGPPASVRVGPAADSPNDLIELAPVSFGAVSGTPGADQAVADLPDPRPSLAVAVLAMLATSVTLVPAVLALGSRRRARSARWTRPPQHATIGRVAGLVARRPAPVALGAVAVPAALGASVLLFQHVLGHDGIDFQLPLVVLLVPALTVLAGKAAWWPSRPRVPRSGHLRSKS